MKKFFAGFIFWISILPCGFTQGILNQEAYRFETTEFPRAASLGQDVGMFVEDCFGQVWSSNSAHLLKLGLPFGEIFATSGKGVLKGTIVKLFTDKQKHLWISTSSGLFYLNPYTQKIYHHRILIDSVSLRSIAVDHCDDYIFAIQNRNRLIRYHPATKRVTLIKLPANFQYISCISKAQNGKTYLVEQRGLFEIRDSGSLKFVAPLPSEGIPYNVAAINDKDVYVSYIDGKLLHINAMEHTSRLLRVEDTLINNGKTLTMVQLGVKTLLAQGTNRGIRWVDPENETQYHWGLNTFQKGITLSGSVGSVLQDRGGRIWIGQQERTLSVPAFTTPQKIYFESDDIVQNFESGYEEGPIAISYDSQKKSFVYGIGDTVMTRQTATGEVVGKTGLKKDARIQGLALLSNGGWIVATTKGIWKIQNDIPELFHDSLANVDGIRLLVKQDTVFVGTSNAGLYILTEQGKLIAHYSKASGMPGNYVAAMCLDRKGSFWFTNGRSGLFTLSNGKPVAKKYDEGELRLTLVYDLQPDKENNNLWIAGEGGFLSYNITTGTTTNITSTVPNGIEFGIWRIYPKKDGKLFLASNGSKLFEWWPEKKQAIPIDFEKGWWGENLLGTSSLTQDGEGNWWGCFRTGISQLSASSYFTPGKVPEPQLRSIFIQYNNWQAHPALYQNEALQIKYFQNPISIVCSSNSSEKTQFKLEGYDDGWNTGEKGTYTNLNSGNYVYRIRAVDEAGNYSEEQVMKLKVLPPWWKTWWFRLAAGLLLAGGIYFFINRRIAAAEKENAYKLNLAQSELKAIRSQMNPHFIFNCMTAIDGLIACNEKEKASNYLGKFSKLMRQVLQLSNEQFIVLSEDLRTLELYLQLEQFHLGEAFTFTIKADESLKEGLEVPPLLLQPFAENAIIHGLKPSLKADKKLDIYIYKKENTIFMEITDNGIGRQEAGLRNKKHTHHTSMGTTLSKERLELMEQTLNLKTDIQYIDLTDDTGVANGTRVVITLKQKQDRV